MDEHREHELWGTLVFRKNGQECSREKASEVRVKGHHYTDDIWWPWPESEATIRMIVQVAKGAYAGGKSDARDAMRRALGIEASNDYDGNETVVLR